jgi:hypothetical protein
VKTLLLVSVLCLGGCAAFSKTATEAEATTAREQIQGVGNTASAMLPPPWNFAAAGGTALVLLVAGLMRGKGKQPAPA